MLRLLPALEGVHGIDCDLPACRAFAMSLPVIDHGGVEYRFNFLRLSSKQQSADPAYHLDSDAATALSGDVTTLRASAGAAAAAQSQRARGADVALPQR